MGLEKHKDKTPLIDVNTGGLKPFSQAGLKAFCLFTDLEKPGFA